ncbi:MAG: hypothetical protein IKW23_00425, partial [Kiritimatiellae bacterium]|nr:hypothetical protein [Kiritimatiellia bacterium]
AIAGVPPFEGETAVDVMKARLLGPARPLTEVAPSCPEGIAKIVMRMLEAEPIRRYPNYDSLLADIAKEVGSGKGGAKRVVLKGAKSKTTSTTVPLKPSQPMTPVDNVNASLFPEEEKGLSKGAMIGIGVGIGVLILIVIGVIVLLAGKAMDKTPAGAAVEAVATVVAVDPAVLQATADAAALAEMGQRIDAAYAEFVAAVKTATNLKDRMVKRADRAVLEEQRSWLSAQEGEAPTEMLRDLQQTFKRLASMSAAVSAAEGLRTKLDDWRTNYENASEVIASATEALTAYEALLDVKGFAANLKAIQEAEKNWQRVVTKARAEMEKAVADQKEAERKAKIAERERLAAEQAKREIEEEVASVTAIEVASTGDLDKFMPEAAETTFKARQARLKSAEAKAASEVVAERIAAFRQLKQFWLEAIQKGQFKTLGIVAADEQSVTLKKKLSWQQFVSSQQNLAFRMILSSIVDDAGARSLRASDRAELAVGAHLFITKYFGKAAVDKSKSLRDAVEKLETLATGLPGTKAKFERLVAPSASESAE